MFRGWEAIQLCSVVILINTIHLNKSLYKPTDSALCHSVAMLHVCSCVVYITMQQCCMFVAVLSHIVSMLCILLFSSVVYLQQCCVYHCVAVLHVCSSVVSFCSMLHDVSYLCSRIGFLQQCYMHLCSSPVVTLQQCYRSLCNSVACHLVTELPLCSNVPFALQQCSVLFCSHPIYLPLYNCILYCLYHYQSICTKQSWHIQLCNIFITYKYIANRPCLPQN